MSNAVITVAFSGSIIVQVSNLNKTLFLVITVVINKELLQEVSYILHYYK